MTRHNKIRILFASFLLLLLPSLCFSEEVIDEVYGYSLDLPEGFELVDQIEEDLTYQFQHQNLPLTLISKIYDDQGFFETQDALDYALSRLSAKYDIATFDWNNSNCAISNFEFTLDKQYTGWAVASPLGLDTYLVLLTYGPTDVNAQLLDFMYSSLNSLCINEYFFNTPGIITTYAYPDEGDEEYCVNIAGKDIKGALDKIDCEASDFVINMEFRILTKYASHPLMYEAWSRYYRMVYRDNYGRISDFSKNALDVLYPLAEENRPENPNIQYAQYLLTWVQNQDYVRAEKRNDSDFSSLPSIVLGGGSDCDSRSMIVAAMLEYSGIDSLLLVYPEFSHAIVGALIPGALGQMFTNPENKEEYIMGETTAKGLTWGIIEERQADRSKCFSIAFPN